MNNQHLTDDQIQEYLDGQKGIPSNIHDHITSCPHCAQVVSDYKMVITSFNTLPSPNLSLSFADNVMVRISKEETLTAKAEQKWAAIGYVSAAFSLVAAMVIVFILFIDKNVLSQWITTALSPLKTFEGSIKSSFSQQLSELGISPTLLLSTALTIVIIAIADRVIVYYRKAHRIFSLTI